MPISAHLHRKLQDTLGADAADEIVNVIESMDAIRGDIGELRHEMQLGFARMEAHVEKGLREHTRFFFLAWSVLLAAIVGLYAR